MPTKKPTILVVEDEDDVRELVVELVEGTGLYTVIQASNGKEALKLIQSHKRWFGILPNRISCIITDIRMPEMDGVSLLEALRHKVEGSGFTPSIPVIFLSGYEDADKWKSAVANRVVEYIKKPLDDQEYQLLNAIERVVFNMEAESMAYYTRQEAIKNKRV